MTATAVTVMDTEDMGMDTEDMGMVMAVTVMDTEDMVMAMVGLYLYVAKEPSVSLTSILEKIKWQNW